MRADRTRLKQILINLLSNAVKYNREGGTVVVDCVLHGPDRTRISVTDSGAGLPPAQLAQLFQPFNRLGQARGAVQGTGIGLVMSKRLAELMGGAMGVESVVGTGSVFWFELATDVAPGLGAGSPPPNDLSAAHVRHEGPLRTVLYVEDNPSNVKLIEKILARLPRLHFLSAPDGSRGVQVARARQPDVILMDINLPGISGAEALAILRADPLTAHIPVVALSANALPRDIEKGLEAGFFAYLPKPIKVTEFTETMNTVLEFARRRAELA